jgi:hypothetical protein
MKLIEALKSVKSLQTKLADLREKITKHAAYMSVETPVYKDQRSTVAGWLQSHEDITREIADLSRRIALTNVTVKVPIKIGENVLTKTITEWIVRRRLLAGLDLKAWEALTDRGLKPEALIPSSSGGEPTKVTIVRCFDPEVRDNKVALYKGEPNDIDVALETVNAVTDLLE